MSSLIQNHLNIKIQGFVQGVGFRPFITRLAHLYQQRGWIANTHEGVILAIQGGLEHQQQFLDALNKQLPPFADIKSLSITPQPLADFSGFQIKASLNDGQPAPFVLPDIATCPDCIRDIFDPASRYYQYPFTSCCQCGPRYSIMARQPYDRQHTSMVGFNLCQDCEQEYQSTDNRRFHAQSTACRNCGPALRLLDNTGLVLAEKHPALLAAVQYLHAGKIVALKGIGGYQLLVHANNLSAIELLRQRKHRPQKPFALMIADLAAAHTLCAITAIEEAALTSSAAPIVLLKRQPGIGIAKAVAPDTRQLGVMLAYSPLHHLLLHELDAPVIATSGNRHNEPICIDDNQALKQLAGIADFFLTHDRPILRPLDDSVVRVINGKMTVLRRARGYTPFPITLNTPLPDMLAVGGQLKSTVAISQGVQVILSQHLGDLDTETAQQQFQATVMDLQQFYQISPTAILHDLHPGYTSTLWANTQKLEQYPVQHHYAHALSCMAEHGLEPPVLAIVWDGAGLGDDNTLWGGEFLLVTKQGYQRYAHFRPFALPGGSKAIQEPRRSALGLLYELMGDQVFDHPAFTFTVQELRLLKSALAQQINCPCTTSVGRLFDAVASLLGLCQINSYEGQAAMMLENSATAITANQYYLFHLTSGDPVIIDWQSTLEQILHDLANNSVELIAHKFHNTLAEIVLAVAVRSGQKTIVFTGGCFQNALLAETAVNKLNSAGFTVYCHEKIPPNDGGLALGQLLAATFRG